jgi:hypothetical protein
MSTEQTTPSPGQADPPPAEWGAPPPPPPTEPKSRWTAKKTIIAVVVAVGIAGAGGAAIYAASGSVDNQAGGPGGGRGGGPMVMGGPLGGMSETQHGEFQTGDVTAISDDSITLKSEDGYEKTYTIDGDTQKSDGIAKGDEVTVVATTENGTTTAESILEFDAMSRRDGKGGPPPGGGKAPGGNN